MAKKTVKPIMKVVENNEQLKESEERYHKMIEEVEDYAIMLLDENGIIQNWNRGAEKIKLYTAEEVLGKHFSLFYLPEDRASHQPEKLLTEARTNGKASREGWRLRKDGTKFWGSITLTALHGPQHEVIGYSKLTRDLTEKKYAEDRLKALTEELLRKNEELTQSEQRYHKMVDEVQEYAIIFLDKDGIIRNWNKGAQKIKQYQESEAVGQHFSMFYLPEDRDGKLPQILLEQAKTHGRALHEGWRMRKDGTKFWGSITLTALRNGDGELIGFSKVTRDLTEKKLSEDQLRNFTAELQLSNEALRKSEERYHKMVSEVQDYAIILLDVSGNIENWNAGAEKIKGYKAQEIIGKNFRIFYQEEDKQQNLPERLLTIARNTGRALHEGWRVRNDGSRFWGSIVITALHDEQGNVIGYSKVTRDLTEKKQAEDKLKEYLVELEHRNEELDRFAYAASHDLQEPLRKIQTFADLIEESVDDQEVVSRNIKKIITSADRMLTLIKSVLQYSRLSNSAYEATDVDLNEVLVGVIGDFELLIEEKKAAINCQTLPVVKADLQQATQLFSNLIHNALKYSGSNPIINVSGTIISSSDIPHWPHHLPGGQYYQIGFSDNGIGFEQQYAEQIFSLFQRLHGKHEYSGAGVGLALCKKIMENHNGYICAEGHLDEGASFYVYFPTKKTT